MEQASECAPSRDNLQTSNRGDLTENYRENAILQTGFNASLIEDTAQFVLRTMTYSTQIPIRILDLCCGNGDFTIALLRALTKAGVKVQEIVGYDYSHTRIAIANKEHAPKESRAKFFERDVALMEDRACFDVVVSFFGLHWLSDSNNAMYRIANALTPGGKLIFFVPLEKMQLFNIRYELSQGRFKEDFGNYSLYPFNTNPNTYTNALRGFFTLENPDAISCQALLDFSKEQFEQFLKSWLPELGAVFKDPERRQEYLDAIWGDIPNQGSDESCSPSLAKNVVTKRLNFFERGLWVHATAHTDIDLALEETCKILKNA